MGWLEEHLYEFEVGDLIIGEKDNEWDINIDREIKSSRSVRLRDIGFVPKNKFEYIYDFDDCWEHEIIVEKVLEPGKGIKISCMYWRQKKMST